MLIKIIPLIFCMICIKTCNRSCSSCMDKKCSQVDIEEIVHNHKQDSQKQNPTDLNQAEEKQDDVKSI